LIIPFMMWLFSMLVAAFLLWIALRKFPRLATCLAYYLNQVYSKYSACTHFGQLGNEGLWDAKPGARKTLVLELEGVLVSTVVQDPWRPAPHSPFDYCFRKPDDGNVVYVYKRPHVDIFLDCVSYWYDLEIFTTADEIHAGPILDYLDGGRRILRRRRFGNDCIIYGGRMVKDLSKVSRNFGNIILLDCSMPDMHYNEGNCWYIEPYCIGTQDRLLEGALLFLNALKSLLVLNELTDVRLVLKHPSPIHARGR
ncbi:hypothetical protein KR018_007927, partial [Drosophila ironensis]